MLLNNAFLCIVREHYLISVEILFYKLYNLISIDENLYKLNENSSILLVLVRVLGKRVLGLFV